MKNNKVSKTKSSKTYQQFYAHVHSKAHSPRSREAYLRRVERLGEHYQPEGPGLRRLRERHPGLYAELDPLLRTMPWNVNLQQVGRGKKAIRYLAAYVGKSAFSESRLIGYDAQRRIQMWWTDSQNGKRRIMTLQPIELIRRWLQHVLPKGFTRVRHYGFLSGAARAAYRRLRFLLGAPAVQIVELEMTPPCCPQCEQTMQRLRKILPARGPPLSAGLLYAQS